MTVEYKEADVLTAARDRVSRVFDEFEEIVVSVSSGKDSTVLRKLAIDESVKRGRQVSLFFLDQEAEHQSSIDLIEAWMGDPRIKPLWYQVPTLMTNATSHDDYWLHAWGPGEDWIRPKSELSIHELADYTPRFYGFFDSLEKAVTKKTAFLVGLRSRESFNRFRAVTKRPGYRDWMWSTKTKNNLAFRVYPIYDWTFGDIWRFIVDEQLEYNIYYDRMFAKYGVTDNMRVSNLVHEKSFRCLVDLQEFEPDTYERLIARLGGVHCAAIYARESYVFNAKTLPPTFSSWNQFRDYLIATTPCDKVARFTKRFAGQPTDEETCRQQCKQLLINDWENSVPVVSPRKRQIKELWWNRL